MQQEGGLAHAAKPGKPGLGVSPEAFDSIDMTSIFGEFIFSVIDAHVFFESQVHQPVVPSPAIGMDHALKVYPATDNGLQRGLSTIRHDLGVDLAVAFEDAENNGLTESAASSPALDPFGSEKAFIDLDFPRKRRLFEAISGNIFTDCLEKTIDRVSIEARDFGNL